MGNNGIGKTNLLEAIFLFSHLKSFRQANEEDLILWGQKGYFVEIDFIDDRIKKNVQIGCQKKKHKLEKKIKISGEVIKRFSDVIGEFLCVIFSPNDLEIINGGPAGRRKIIDLIICQRDGLYLQNLIEYNRILKQRNVLLKKNYKNKNIIESLFVWDEQLVKRGELIIERRESFIKEIQPYFFKNIESISGYQENWQIKYLPNVISSEFGSSLKKKENKDRLLGRTSRGPHLDKIMFYPLSEKEENNINKDALYIASQGQKRTLVLALKMAQYNFIEENLNKKAVLLIDDVITELDFKRRQKFVELLKNSGQTFFTTTSLSGLEDIRKDLEKETEIFKITELF